MSFLRKMVISAVGALDGARGRDCGHASLGGRDGAGDNPRRRSGGENGKDDGEDSHGQTITGRSKTRRGSAQCVAAVLFRTLPIRHDIRLRLQHPRGAADFMKFTKPLVHGILVKRYKRFLADVRLADGSIITAHCPNSGSLLGCKDEGFPAWLLESDNPNRALRYTWVLVKAGPALVNIETNIPNRVVFESAKAGEIPELKGYESARREVPYGTNSRIDILLEGRAGDPRPCYVEVKCTTLAEGGHSRFPDAVTERGLKHLVELQKLVKKGSRAVQFFFCSRTDAISFRPADDIDPDYSKELRKAARNGVEVLARRADITLQGITMGPPVPVDLS